jgi:hypothetical protein
MKRNERSGCTYLDDAENRIPENPKAPLENFTKT